ncbi:helicase domain-containing protein [Prunus dulcis]|uniref:Helicase domain-containing protein n=1 Tax=Prunus dulcis TaxID=3755 RepID=A0A5H2Y2B8_PRUDU|nr:helicase domain-containing protein [Prunus dulcis]
MGSESNLNTWVSDKLMTLLGYSQPTVVQYIIGLTKQAKSPADVVGKLVEFGLSSSAETSAFAEDIFARVPRKESGLNLYQKQEREAAMLVKKQKTYSLLDADDEDDNDGDTSSAHVISKSRKADSHKKRFRKKVLSQEDEDDEVIAQEGQVRRVKRRTCSPDDDDGSESEEERLRDQREREQLEQNIRERDTAATRKLTDRKLTRKEEEEAIRRSNALERNDLEDLRKVSRQEYLKKREQKKLEEIKTI